LRYCSRQQLGCRRPAGGGQPSCHCNWVPSVDLEVVRQPGGRSRNGYTDIAQYWDIGPRGVPRVGVPSGISPPDACSTARVEGCRTAGPVLLDGQLRPLVPRGAICRKPGKSLGGYWGPRSFAGLFPNDGDIYLEAVYFVNADGTFGQPVDGTRGALIRKDQYACIELFEIPGPSVEVVDVEE
jgi:hypothetical protein